MVAVAQSFDAVVIGAGPAGSAAAARLARAGRSVLVLESARFPRFHIGESLLPLGDQVFRDIGFGEQLEHAGFVTKHGAQLRSPCGEHTVLFDFAENRIRPSTTIQVHRAEFDAMMLDHATSLGARCEQARARSYVVDGDGVTLTYASADGRETSVRAAALIDASGRAGFVARQERVRTADPDLNKASTYAHFRGVPLDEGKRAGDTRIVMLPDLGWMWLIPLKGDVVSVGVVLDAEHYRQQQQGDLAATFDRAVQSAPLAVELLANAERVSEFGAESGFSYRAERYAGDRWFLAGDAGSFLDPVWSTGVQMALQSGVEAADALVAGYLLPRPAAERAIEGFDRKLQRRYRFVRRFVIGFYDPHVRDLFFSPRPYFGIHRAVTRVLAGGFDLGWLNRLRLGMFFLLGKLQARFELVPRLVSSASAATDAPAAEPVLERS